MNFDQFRYVDAIVRYGSFNKAAAALYVSQSSISSSIKTLESELHETIFIRHRDGVSLTPFGVEFLRYVHDVLEITDFSPIFRNKNETNYGASLSVCSGNRIEADLAAAEVYRKMKDKKIRLRIYDVRMSDSENMVISGDAELAVATIWSYEKMDQDMLKRKGLCFVKLADLFPCVNCGPLNPLFERKENWVTIDMLKGMSVILYTATSAIHTISANTLLHSLNYPLNNSSILSSDSRFVRTNMLTMTDAISFGSSSEIHLLKDQSPERHIFRIAGTDLSCELGYLIKKDHSLGPEATLFTEALQKIVAEGNHAF